MLELAFEFALHLRRVTNLLGAQRYFQRALASDPLHAGALEALIDSYLRGGKAELARAQFDRADKTAFPADTIRFVPFTLRLTANGSLGMSTTSTLESVRITRGDL